MTTPIAQGPVDVNVRGWQPIETAPKNGFSRLYRINGFCVQGFVDATGALMVQSEIDPHWRMARGKPTHWMPLPDAPNVIYTPEKPT